LALHPVAMSIATATTAKRLPFMPWLTPQISRGYR
jgi:hypothetical protein